MLNVDDVIRGLEDDELLTLKTVHRAADLLRFQRTEIAALKLMVAEQVTPLSSTAQLVGDLLTHKGQLRRALSRCLTQVAEMKQTNKSLAAYRLGLQTLKDTQ